jgi:hypothetical protein
MAELAVIENNYIPSQSSFEHLALHAGADETDPDKYLAKFIKEYHAKEDSKAKTIKKVKEAKAETLQIPKMPSLRTLKKSRLSRQPKKAEPREAPADKVDDSNESIGYGRITSSLEAITGKKDPKHPKIALKAPTLSIFCARSNSGKSHLMKSILYTLARESKISWVYVLTSTSFNNEWSDIVGSNNVTDQFDVDWIEDLMNKQGLLVKKDKAEPGLIIFDDMVGTANWNSEIMTKIAISARHYNISCWISTQWYFKLSTTLRGNCNYMYILNNVSDKIAKTLHEEIPSIKFNKARELQQYANLVTQNYGVLMYDNTGGNPKVYAIRAPASIPKFKLLEHKKATKTKR